MSRDREDAAVNRTAAAVVVAAATAISHTAAAVVVAAAATIGRAAAAAVAVTIACFSCCSVMLSS